MKSKILLILMLLVGVVYPWSAGINFRATSGYVTDSTGFTYCTGDVYPTTRGGYTFGFVSNTFLNSRDRSTSPESYFSGGAFRYIGDNGNDTFVLDLPSSGSYSIKVAISDYQYHLSTNQLFYILDSNTVIDSIKLNISTDKDSVLGIDNKLYGYNYANLPTKTLSFSKQTLKVVFNPVGSGLFNSLSIVSYSSDTAASITVQPQNTTVDVGETANFSLTAVGTSRHYQWHKNNSHVGSDQNSYSYSTVLSDNGDSIYCEVWASIGSTVTSNTVYTTVNDTGAIRIVSTNGKFIHDSSLVINGKKFSLKPRANPITFESFEDGTASTTTPDLGVNWTNMQNISISTDSLRSNNSYNGHTNFGNANRRSTVTGNNSVLAKNWYAEYHWLVSTNWDWGSKGYPDDDKFLANIKLFRLWNPGDVDEDFFCALDGAGNTIFFQASNTNEVSWNIANDFKNNKGTWRHFQFAYSENTGVNQKDGKFRMWIDGKLIFSRDTIMTRSDFSVLKRPYIIGFENEWGATEGTPDVDGWQEPNDFYIDDIYMDTTWSRVEIGNRSVYDSCTLREIQIPTYWSDDSINITVNKGSLSGDSIFLFVVDDTGAVSDGYRLYDTNTAPSSIEITAQPQPDTVKVGAQITFSISATGDSLHYGWYKNSIYTGVSTPTYSFTTTLADNGKYVRCVVWNSQDTVWSDSALITAYQPCTWDSVGTRQGIYLKGTRSQVIDSIKVGSLMEKATIVGQDATHVESYTSTLILFKGSYPVRIYHQYGYDDYILDCSSKKSGNYNNFFGPALNIGL